MFKNYYNNCNPFMCPMFCYVGLPNFYNPYLSNCQYPSYYTRNFNNFDSNFDDFDSFESKEELPKDFMSNVQKVPLEDLID